MELISEVKKQLPNCKQGEIYNAIAENDIKNNSDYSAYNFRSKKHEDEFKNTGKLPSGTPNIYKTKAVEFIVQILKNEKE